MDFDLEKYMHDLDLGNEFRKIWEDQKEFNKNFWSKPDGSEDRTAQTKELVLYMVGEMYDLLEGLDYKLHRRDPVPENLEQSQFELIDIFKYWLTLAQLWGMDPSRFIQMYWRKSMAVRQRYSQEFLEEIDGPCVVVDIDNVLADYTGGIVQWIRQNYPDLEDRCDRLRDGQWIDSRALQIQEGKWQEIKHRFRTTGGKRRLPLVPGARNLLEECQRRAWDVILLTSRPIDKYPNIYTDTVEWLATNELPYQHIWWATDKAERILSAGVRPWVQFFVDDDLSFCEKVAGLGIKTLWFTHQSQASVDMLMARCPYGPPRPGDRDRELALRSQIQVIRSLDQIDVEALV